MSVSLHSSPEDARPSQRHDTTPETTPSLPESAATNRKNAIAKAELNSPPRESYVAEAADTVKDTHDARPRVTIGTVEIRAVMAQKPVAQPAPIAPSTAPVAQGVPARPAETAPLARGLGWSFGLVQG